MLDHSPLNLVGIRTSIVLLANAPLLELLLLILLIASKLSAEPRQPSSTSYVGAVSILASLLTLELIFYLVLYRPHLARLKRDAQHPAPLTRQGRLALFEKCAANIPDPESYVRLWFLGAALKDIKRDNVRDFFLWAFLDRDGIDDGGRIQEPEEDDDVAAEVDYYISRTETLLGRKFPPGRGSATCLRLTIDAVQQRYRSVLWYVIVAGVDLATHLHLARDGFRYYGPPLSKTLYVFPPRLQIVPTLVPFWGARRYRSASGELGFWFRPHTARNARPVVFIHGIGVGLWPYTSFLNEIGRPSGANCRTGDEDDGQIGVMALEILPISTRLTDPPLRQDDFLRQLHAILSAHAPGWLRDGFVLVSHSYGSVLTTHIIRSPHLAPHVRGVVLIDPVSLLLHLPDVAYNFTRRPPRTANEWQLWFFASMDVGVAEGLGRHFFWRENLVWKEELVGHGVGEDGEGLGQATRKVAVCLAGRDLIVPTQRVARYLARRDENGGSANPGEDVVESLFPVREAGNVASGSSPRCMKREALKGVEILWFPSLDHAQVFDAREDREHVLGVISRYCTIGSGS